MLDPLQAASPYGRHAALLLAALLWATPALGQHVHADGSVPRVAMVRVDAGPAIDGSLTDDVWQRATVIDDFVQQEPDEGAAGSERTEVRLLYDQNTIYVGVHAFDSDPAGIIATEMRRDSERILEEDNFQLILDTFSDSRSGYMFAVSPLGAQLEQQIAEEGEGGRRSQGGTSSNINREWDGVWDVEARRTADGWVAEIAIPVVTLRFPDGDAQEWGVNFMRNISRKNEQAYWAPVTKGHTLTRVSLAGRMTEIRSLNRGRDIRVKPFAISGGRRRREGSLPDNSFQRDLGVDLKFGITAGLNLDLTLNTDFAQAEVDDERVNLTRFALFYPEKRDFFLENAGQFNVGTTASNDRIADLFFSRRIGITEGGDQVPIIAGGRLTGKVGRNSIALLNVQTDEAENPAENFLVARYSRDIMERSRVGALVINKQAMEGGHYNRTVAADMSLALTRSFTVNGFLARTQTPGMEGDDMGMHLRAGILDQRWNVYAEFTDLDDNFNAEVGYIPRVGIRTTKLHLERNPRPGRFGIRLLEPMWNVTYTTDQSNRLVSRRNHLMLGVRLESGASIIVWHNQYFERLDDPFTVRRGVVVAPGAYNFGESRISFTSNPARRVYTSVAYSPQEFFDGTRNDIDVRLGVRVNSSLSTEGGFTRNDVDLPGGAFEADIGSLRIDYAMSPSMTLRTLTQYNSLTEQWSTSARFRYTYRPGSDFYIVYNELRRDPTGLAEFRDRQLILKLTYLLSR